MDRRFRWRDSWKPKGKKVPEEASTSEVNQRQDLFFINRSTSAGPRLKFAQSERRKVNSHVQLRKSTGSRPIQQLESKDSAGGDDEITVSAVNEANRPSPPDCPSSRTRESQSGGVPIRLSSIKRRALAYPDYENRGSIRPQRVSLHENPTGNSLDPFGATINQDSHAQPLLRLWLDHMQIWFDEMRTSGDNQQLMMTNCQNIIRNILGDELQMYCLLVYISSFQRSFLSPVSVPSPTYYMGKALSALRQYFIRGEQRLSTLDLLRSVYNICTAEAFRSHVLDNSYMPHLHALKYFVDQAGGFDQLEDQLKMAIIIADVHIAVGHGDTPVFPLTWDPGRLPQHVLKRLYVSLNHTESKGVLPSIEPAVCIIFDDIHQLVAVEELNTVLCSADLNLWLKFRTLAILHRLMSSQRFPVVDPDASNEPAPFDSKSNLIRHALTLYTLITMTNWFRSQLESRVAERVRTGLEIWRQKRAIEAHLNASNEMLTLKTEVEPSSRPSTTPEPYSSGWPHTSFLSSPNSMSGSTEAASASMKSDTKSRSLHSHKSHLQLELWILTLGCIATSPSPHRTVASPIEARDNFSGDTRSWFQGELTKTATDSSITSPEEWKDFLNSILHIKEADLMRVTALIQSTKLRTG